jgi:D-alanyl-D-alanine dipeptidase
VAGPCPLPARLEDRPIFSRQLERIMMWPLLQEIQGRGPPEGRKEMRDLRPFTISLLTLCWPGGASATMPQGFVRLADVVPGIVEDIRYATRDNFTGRPVPGYRAPCCWLRREVADALVLVQKEAEAAGLTLVVYDCYRPQRATQAFVAWAEDKADQAMKQSYYPQIDKAQLFDLGYIAKASAHSTGTAVDIGLVDKDFGTPFDLFDAASATKHPGIAAEARQNRETLLGLMQRHGFVNLPEEWWHFSLPVAGAEPSDFEIR